MSKILNLTYIFLIIIISGMVSAIDINSPIATNYTINDIALNVSNNETLESLSYNIDGGSVVIACTNCSTYTSNLNLTNGSHTLNVFGTNNNLTINNSVLFNILIAVLNETNATTNITTNVTINDTNNTNMTGNNTGNTTTNVTTNTTTNISSNNTNFTQSDFSITILDPESKTYYEYSLNKLVAVNVKTNVTVDSLMVTLNENNWSCTNCSSLNNTINLTYGNYSVIAFGLFGNISKNTSINFALAQKYNYSNNNTDDDDDDNKTGNYSKFTTGFEKLPKMVAAGEISDAELANIIRNNKLNPGVLNRLIKTGKLGNESLNAILDTQFKPQGILGKLLGKLGVKNTYSALIVDRYNLSEENKEKVVSREDLPPKAKEKIVEEIKITKKDSNWVPPGQAKKSNRNSNDNSDNDSSADSDNDSDDDSDNNSTTDDSNGRGNSGKGKIPPGQAKKNR